MSDDNKIYKSGVLDFEVSAYQSDSTNSNIVFFSQDTGGTAKLVFNLKKEGSSLPLSSATSPKLIMIMSDSSRYIVNPIVSDRLTGQATYSLTDEQLTHSGIVQCELYVAYTNQGMQIHKFEFNIDKALIDSNIIPTITYYVQTWNEWEAYFQSEMDTLQAELDDLQAQADSQQEQFDNLNPAQFAQKTDLDNHVNNLDIHVTATDKTNWNAKETTEGAQTKADTALNTAKTYTDSKLDSYGAWINVPLASGFSTGDGNTPQYRILQVATNEGVKTFIEYRGAIAGTFLSSSNSTVANIPVGTRPLVTEYFAVASNNGNGGRIAVTTTGELLQVSSTANANPSYISLSDIYYEVSN
ncbi:DUF2479 domain-containing protein [Listeria monocytogenes]|uniref:BppU family phage baseplate upper protein n=1 Tax=Listeria monocytogenes TaxID=1639 RepID=UPI00077A7D62|nr:BppU family phage baseplate upper protein [Listeria monocytogenes]EAC2379266.1 DUF2479 domain-containing protein [Listeria monocytogenes]EAD9262723.1 DUF2479 domain-containing protein [Listeria monocytogenes]EAE1596973.1 DUF2479 domain-containing protein [Listeria monocytogenes]EAE1602413.1 DUF2479 domain-containing protein [Listeria monocytogenes]EAG2063990.1 DUF2479 domain-containing protein [Listeria monocytogenes]